MKKIISISLALCMLFCFASCKKKNPYPDISKEQISQKIDKGEMGEFTCYYSVNNEDKTDNEILVSFPLDVYSDKDIFCKEGKDSVLKFYDKPGKIFYDIKTGEEVKEEDLKIGQQLKVTYDTTIESSDPVTIRPIKVCVYR